MLCRLRAAEPACEFRLLIGADSVASIPNWRDPMTWNGSNPNGEDLLREFSLIVYPRQNIEYQIPSVSGCRVYDFRDPRSGALLVEPGRRASRELRAHVWTDPSARFALPAGVWEYIRNNRLYQPDDGC